MVQRVRPRDRLSKTQAAEKVYPINYIPRNPKEPQEMDNYTKYDILVLYGF